MKCFWIETLYAISEKDMLGRKYVENTQMGIFTAQLFANMERPKMVNKSQASLIRMFIGSKILK